MKPSKKSVKFRPFENLKDMLDKKSVKLAPAAPRNTSDEKTPETQTDPESEDRMFLEAMEGVRRVPTDKRPGKNIDQRAGNVPEPDPDIEALSLLENLVHGGRGFVVSDTPEYIEGTGYKVNPGITKRLHSGEFSIQGHIDLHGYNVPDARDAFEAFMKDAVMSGKRAVLIVHGRGLSSPDRPVLKTKVYEWLTRGPWRKWVIAFTSARPCDGGAGATYVLLRDRPATRRFRKGQKRF